jgi:hypothetical protein
MIGVDLGQTPIKDFTTLKPDTTEDTATQLPHILHPEEKGLQNDKPNAANQPHTIQEYILPPQHRPTHHRPDLVKAIGYTINSNGQIIPDPTYREKRQIQIIECKYSTDGNTQALIEHIYNIYEPLKQALQTHGTLKAEIKIIPIVISRTGTFNVRTLAEIAQVVSFREEPPDTLTYKQLPKPAQKIAMTLHIHAQEWLYTSPKSQEKSSPQNQRSSLHRKTYRHNTLDIKHSSFGTGKWRRRTSARGYGLPRAGSF